MKKEEFERLEQELDLAYSKLKPSENLRRFLYLNNIYIKEVTKMELESINDNQ